MSRTRQILPPTALHAQTRPTQNPEAPKHLAATFYLLAEAFDADPFLILRWRGRDREALLGRLRELRADGPAEPAAEPEPGAAGARRALADLVRPPQPLDQFWLPPPPLPIRPSPLAVEADLLLRQLPEPGAGLGGELLLTRLRSAYQRFGGQA